MRTFNAALLYSATALVFTSFAQPALALQAPALALQAQAQSITQGWCMPPSGIEQTCTWVNTPPNNTGACLMGGYGQNGVTQSACDSGCQQVCTNMGGTWTPGIL